MGRLLCGAPARGLSARGVSVALLSDTITCFFLKDKPITRSARHAAEQTKLLISRGLLNTSRLNVEEHHHK